VELKIGQSTAASAIDTIFLSDLSPVTANSADIQPRIFTKPKLSSANGRAPQVPIFHTIG
jgi:hypothetical protein